MPIPGRDPDLAVLEAALAAALRRAAPLPAAARLKFIGRSLLAAHAADKMPLVEDLPSASNLAALKGDVPELCKVLSAAVNAARGHQGWPLLAVGNQLLSAANAADTTTLPVSLPFAVSTQAKRATVEVVEAQVANRGGYGSLAGPRSGAGKFGSLGKGKAGNGDGLTFAEMERRMPRHGLRRYRHRHSRSWTWTRSRRARSRRELLTPHGH
jgi:hypothetical protein